MKVDDYVDNIAEMSRIISTVKQQNNELDNVNLSSSKVLSASIWGINQALEITHLYVREYMNAISINICNEPPDTKT